jgi:hypothetical protein
MFNIGLFILGFLLMLYGNFFILIYINLLNSGYNITSFISYLFKRSDIYFVIIGLIMIIISLIRKD